MPSDAISNAASAKNEHHQRADRARATSNRARCRASSPTSWSGLRRIEVPGSRAGLPEQASPAAASSAREAHRIDGQTARSTGRPPARTGLPRPSLRTSPTTPTTWTRVAFRPAQARRRRRRRSARASRSCAADSLITIASGSSRMSRSSSSRPPRKRDLQRRKVTRADDAKADALHGIEAGRPAFGVERRAEAAAGQRAPSWRARRSLTPGMPSSAQMNRCWNWTRVGGFLARICPAP